MNTYKYKLLDTIIDPINYKSHLPISLILGTLKSQHSCLYYPHFTHRHVSLQQVRLLNFNICYNHFLNPYNLLIPPFMDPNRYRGLWGYLPLDLTSESPYYYYLVSTNSNTCFTAANLRLLPTLNTLIYLEFSFNYPSRG